MSALLGTEVRYFWSLLALLLFFRLRLLLEWSKQLVLPVKQKNTSQRELDVAITISQAEMIKAAQSPH